jgi:hypothetical protein
MTALDALLIVSFTEDIHKGLFTSFPFHIPMKIAHTADDIVDYLNSNNPSTILITDACITHPKNALALEKVKQYTVDGGTVVFACQFAHQMSPVDFNTFFRKNFLLPWKFGLEGVYVVGINKAVVGKPFKSPCRLATVAGKAVYLVNVKESDAVFLTTENSDGTPPQAPAAWARVGNGWVGYLGYDYEDDAVDYIGAAEELVPRMCGY